MKKINEDKEALDRSKKLSYLRKWDDFRVRRE